MQLLVNIDVDELERAIDFYTRAFDLKLMRRLFDNSVAELQGASSPIYLILKPAGTTTSPSAIRDYRRHWTPIHLDFAVEDLAAAVTRALAAGAKLEGQIESFLWGRQASFSDPFGHGFCLIEFTASGYNAGR
jgi:predicted enzyme related to lactoylglutathione lyase